MRPVKAFPLVRSIVDKDCDNIKQSLSSIGFDAAKLASIFHGPDPDIDKKLNRYMMLYLSGIMTNLYIKN